MLLSRKGQSTAEYAIIIGAVVGAIMAIGVFLRGAIEGKVRHMGNLYLANGTMPSNYTTGTISMTSDYETRSASYTSTMENAATGMDILVGNGTEQGAEASSYSKRVGNVTYFGR